MNYTTRFKYPNSNNDNVNSIGDSSIIPLPSPKDRDGNILPNEKYIMDSKPLNITMVKHLVPQSNHIIIKRAFMFKKEFKKRTKHNQKKILFDQKITINDQNQPFFLEFIGPDHYKLSQGSAS
ncbi:hypothetical protein ACTFIU_004502 [Dictyostelium citrinum]